MTNGKRKGKEAEQQFANKLKEHWGIEARRGQQYKGSPDSPDVVTSLPDVHFEVKWYANGVSPWPVLDQAEGDMEAGQIPVAGIKKNHGDWLLCLRVEDVPRFVAHYLERAKA